MPSAKIFSPPSSDQLKTPTKEALEVPMLQVERAIDSALKKDFDAKSCEHLADCLSELQLEIVDPDSDLPITISDDAALSSKVLVVIDIAYCCWRNDGSEVALDDDIILNHIARMKLNPSHCKQVLDLTRLFLRKHDRLLSVESAMLRV
jgi:hypothetical protein